MEIAIRPDADAAARDAAAFITNEARRAVADRGRFVLGVSGGRTPWPMLRELAAGDLPWTSVEVLQVDERVAPAGSPDRNLTSLRECLSAAPFPPEQIHAMPVESPDLPAAAAEYSELLHSIAGSPPVLDLVHLGLGNDGHTASLVPGDPVLDVADADVALAAEYAGRRRMTLTYPVLNRSRCVLWLVTGAEKADMLARLCEGDRRIPAGRIQQDRAMLFADAAAAGRITKGRTG